MKWYRLLLLTILFGVPLVSIAGQKKKVRLLVEDDEMSSSEDEAEMLHSASEEAAEALRPADEEELVEPLHPKASLPQVGQKRTATQITLPLKKDSRRPAAFVHTVNNIPVPGQAAAPKPTAIPKPIGLPSDMDPATQALIAKLQAQDLQQEELLAAGDQEEDASFEQLLQRAPKSKLIDEFTEEFRTRNDYGANNYNLAVLLRLLETELTDDEVERIVNALIEAYPDKGQFKRNILQGLADFSQEAQSFNVREKVIEFLLEAGYTFQNDQMPGQRSAQALKTFEESGCNLDADMGMALQQGAKDVLQGFAEGVPPLQFAPDHTGEIQEMHGHLTTNRSEVIAPALDSLEEHLGLQKWQGKTAKMIIAGIVQAAFDLPEANQAKAKELLTKALTLDLISPEQLEIVIAFLYS